MSNRIIVRCDRCKIKNRLDINRLQESPKCGKCGHPLHSEPYYDHVLELTDQTFTTEVLSHSGPVLLDFWAPWCGPCGMVGPIMDQLANEHAGRLKVAKMNLDENPQTASRFGIRSVPTLLFFKDGNLVKTLPGAFPKHEIEKFLSLIL